MDSSDQSTIESILYYTFYVLNHRISNKENLRRILYVLLMKCSMNRIQFYYYLTDLYYTNFVSNKLKPVDYISNSTLLQYILHDVCT